MLGAIIGDIAGVPYEFDNLKSLDFELFDHEDTTFSDDSVLTFATADKLLNHLDYLTVYRKWPKKYPFRGYGGRFADWIDNCEQNPEPYNSFGNGSAMRVSPVGWAFNSLDEVLAEAYQSAAVTHNHPEGIKGAQATAAAIFLARTGRSKAEIKEYITTAFGYDLSQTCAEIRPDYDFNETCQGTVPQAITAFLESNDFEHAVKLAVSLGGDSDTIACITGSIAEAFYKEIPKWIEEKAISYLSAEMRHLLEDFREKYQI